MKSLIATLVLLLCVLTLSGINFYYVNTVVREMEERLDALPAVEDTECYARTEELCAYWAEKERAIEMTISYPFVDRICEQAALLSACASVGDVYGFYSAKALLYDALDDLARAEQFSLGSLL